MKSVYITQKKLKSFIYSKVFHTLNYKHLTSPTAALRPFLQAFVHYAEIHFQNKPHLLQSVQVNVAKLCNSKVVAVAGLHSPQL